MDKISLDIEQVKEMEMQLGCWEYQNEPWR